MVDINEYRKAAHDIDPMYLNRWSPRAFLNKEVPEKVLNSLFEAARWAPSAANKQPWHFIYAKTDSDRERFLSFIYEGNTIWCDKAPVLVAVVSSMPWGDDSSSPNPTHAFDTGAAWGYLALEATRKGLITHGMGGFDREKAKEVLQIPDHYAIHAIIAIGYQGKIESLTEEHQQKEKPSDRDLVGQFTSEGLFLKKG